MRGAWKRIPGKEEVKWESADGEMLSIAMAV